MTAMEWARSHIASGRNGGPGAPGAGGDTGGADGAAGADGASAGASEEAEWCRPIQFDQVAGQVVFVPHNWGHAVLNLEPVLAVSTQIGVYTDFDHDGEITDPAGLGRELEETTDENGHAREMGGGEGEACAAPLQPPAAVAAPTADDLQSAATVGHLASLGEDDMLALLKDAAGGAAADEDALRRVQEEMDALDRWYAEQRAALLAQQDANRQKEARNG